jgi:hypothetical protein
MENFIIRIEMLENGYTVEVPDVEAINKKEAAAAKEKGHTSSDRVYTGDCTEKKVAKTTGEVLSIVKNALANLPESEYADAFDEASAKETK